ncbi:MAG: TIM barrel protein [Chloroflexi bacterium]|nr:TIM barrel protein [Chloroflexota bacterium]
MSLKQSFSWDGFARTGIEPRPLIEGSKAIGYDGIDLPPPEFWPMIRDGDLRISAVTGHPLEAEGIAHRRAFSRLEDSILARLEEAIAWEIPVMLCFSGNRGVDELTDDRDAAIVAAEFLRGLAPHFEAAGVTLTLELLNSKHPTRNCYADRTLWGALVCSLVESPRVKLLYDIFHMQIMEGDLIRTIQANHTCIGHVHTAGNPGRNELDAAQEINYPAVLRALADTGYQGWVGHEYFPLREPVESLREAYLLTAAATAALE